MEYIQKKIAYDFLSNREKEILLLVALGKLDEEISSSLKIVKSVVRKHVVAINRKLSLQNRAQMVIYCYENSILSIDINKDYRR